MSYASNITPKHQQKEILPKASLTPTAPPKKWLPKVIHSKLFLDFFATLHWEASPEDFAIILDRRGQGQLVPINPFELISAWEPYGINLIPKKFVVDPRNLHVSVNRFHQPWINEKLVKGFNALFVDVDCYNPALLAGGRGVSGEEMWEHFKAVNFFPNLGLPEPWAISSGQGLYLLWLLTGVHTLTFLPAPLRVVSPVPRFFGWGNLLVDRECQERLYRLLKNYGADPQATDATHSLRAVGTFHANGKLVRSLNKPGDRYRLEELANCLGVWVPWENDGRRPPVRSKSRRTPDRIFLKTGTRKNAKTLYENRMRDFTRLNKIRGGFKRDTYRNFAVMNFATSAFLSVLDGDGHLKDSGFEFIQEETLRYNDGFKEPLPVREVTSVIKAVVRRTGRPRPGDPRSASNKKIIARMGITLEEQRELVTIIGPEEKHRRRITNILETKKGKRVVKVIQENPNLTQTQIGQLAGVSQTDVSRVIQGAGLKTTGKAGRPRKYVSDDQPVSH